MATPSHAPEGPGKVPPFRRGLQAVLDIMGAAGTVWIFGLMLMIMADVAGRNLLQMPVTGVAEIASRSVVAIVFLMLPAAALRGNMVRADFLVSRLNRVAPGVIRLLEWLFCLAGVAIFVLIAVSAWPDTAEAWRTREFFGVQGVWTLPVFPFRLIIVVSGFATALALAIAQLMPVAQTAAPLEI
ncbi:TRAP transporter small permease [Cereibacter changlensis JA139]|uniref:TRAP transporter small permease protein n=2 Tax=Cereibacter changlensis TaxID=402884 RepID=A0A2T4JZM5_9RHOB|nr:TRAP transporter small permease [Cereibacter changlensis]PTE23371.1 TRAP transporter small permease [Cereibacter changlensis JA139]PZX48572.1 TRAP-type mannitol/chloroaromatic compound transport system permease small subunit [Cereibacter changlensis]